jgi:hypothetical protein
MPVQNSSQMNTSPQVFNCGLEKAEQRIKWHEDKKITGIMQAEKENENTMRLTDVSHYMCTAWISEVSSLQKKEGTHQEPVAHTCNLGYLGGWDLEDHEASPCKQFTSPHLQNNQSRAGGAAQTASMRTWVQTPVHPKKKNHKITKAKMD